MGSNIRADSRNTVWWCCAYLFTTAGLLCAYGQWGWSGLATAALIVGTFALLVGSCAWSDLGRHGAFRAVGYVLVAGTVLTGATGLGAVFHAWALGVLVPLAVCSPPALAGVRRLRKLVGSGGTRESTSEVTDPLPESLADSAVDRTPTVLPPDLRELDDADLCLAWRRSFLRLSTAATETEKLWIVQQRQRYLDELHRRSPQGLLAWFLAGGRASGDPLPFLDHRGTDDPWRGLTPPDTGEAHL